MIYQRFSLLKIVNYFIAKLQFKFQNGLDFVQLRSGVLRILALLCMVLCSLGPMRAQAQFRVDVSGIGLSQIPFSMATFKGEETSPQKISTIIFADLERSGQFRAIEAKGESAVVNSRDSPQHCP